jgi:hypothetical protein
MYLAKMMLGPLPLMHQASALTYNKQRKKPDLWLTRALARLGQGSYLAHTDIG